jgi:hypothetical protein
MTTPPRIPKGFLYRFEHWGKPFWNVMHSVTFTYPEKPTQEDKDRIKAFFAVMPFFLPCSICGAHFVKEQLDMPLTEEVLASMDSLSRWLVDLHNSVNRRLKKPELAYETIKKFYFEDATVDPRNYPAKVVLPIHPPFYKKAFWFMAFLFTILAVVFIVMVLVPKCKKRQIFSNCD